MSTKQNPQMAEVLVNTSTMRIATNNDLIKYYMVELLKAATAESYSTEAATAAIVLLREQMEENKKQGGTQHAPKHAQAVADKFKVEIKTAKVPTQKFIFED